MNHPPTERTITVRWSAHGFHCWPEAAGQRGYLSSRHRHRFDYEARVVVDHNDRDVEFHDLQDYLISVTGSEEHGRKSCEDLAQEVGDAIEARWPGRGRSVSVFEDGDVGATLVWRTP